MKILIISDIHGNLEALNSVIRSERFDNILCLGDLVDYGPSPKEVIDIIRENCYKIVRGNHDNALSFNMDCGCSYKFKHLSLATREYQRKIMDNDEIAFLRNIPVTEDLNTSGYRFFMAHASPKGDLFTYLKPETENRVWEREIEGIDADFILLGHTHLPLVKKIGRSTIINPGSVGQPRDNNPNASYAVWDNGDAYIKRCGYDIQKTISDLKKQPYEKEVIEQLSNILIRGS